MISYSLYSHIHREEDKEYSSALQFDERQFLITPHYNDTIFTFLGEVLEPRSLFL